MVIPEYLRSKHQRNQVSETPFGAVEGGGIDYSETPLWKDLPTYLLPVLVVANDLVVKLEKKKKKNISGESKAEDIS